MQLKQSSYRKTHCKVLKTTLRRNAINYKIQVIKKNVFEEYSNKRKEIYKKKLLQKPQRYFFTDYM